MEVRLLLLVGSLFLIGPFVAEGGVPLNSRTRGLEASTMLKVLQMQKKKSPRGGRASPINRPLCSSSPYDRILPLTGRFSAEQICFSSTGSSCSGYGGFRCFNFYSLKSLGFGSEFFNENQVRILKIPPDQVAVDIAINGLKMNWLSAPHELQGQTSDVCFN